MITEKDFARVILALSRTLPRMRPWDEAALALAWMTFPEKAKQELTPEVLLYAAGQRRLDPKPPDDVPLDLSLLAYVYRNENGKPNVAWGLKADLPQRMASPSVFHPQPVPGQIVAAPEPPVTNPLLKGVF